MIELKKDTFINFLYTNWRGKYSFRKCKVICVLYGNTEYHKDNQFLLKGFDIEKQEERIYAIKDMSVIEETVL